LAASSQSWTVRVVLHAEDRVQVQAEQGGHEVQVLGDCPTSIDAVLKQIERWFEHVQPAEIHVAVRTEHGAWAELDTRRWRVAAYFVLAQYERAFVSRGVGSSGAASAANGEQAAASDPARETVVIESGVVVTGQLIADEESRGSKGKGRP
jgi:hypothetical protein